MKYTTYIIIIFFFSLWSGCRKDYNTTQIPIDLSTPVSFSNDLIPIFTADCAKASCHVAGTQTPDMEATVVYEQLMGLGYVDTTNAEGSILYIRMNSISKPMPPSGKLTSDKIAKVLAWIKQGGLDN